MRSRPRYALLMGLLLAPLTATAQMPTEATLRQQIRTAGMMFATFVATAVVFGWLMYPLPL